jgi:Tfp pilus assembly protein PilF
VGLLPKTLIRHGRGSTAVSRAESAQQCIGMVYQKQKNTAVARKHLQRTLQINPNFPGADEIRETLNRMSS